MATGVDYSNRYFINGNDCWVVWNVLPEKGVYAELEKEAKRKEQWSHVWLSENGTQRYTGNVFFESRVLLLPMVFICDNKADYLAKKSLFFNYLKNGNGNGYFAFDCIGLNRRFRLLYDDNPTVEVLTPMNDYPFNDVVVRFGIQVIDDFPADDEHVPDEFALLTDNKLTPLTDNNGIAYQTEEIE